MTPQKIMTDLAEDLTKRLTEMDPQDLIKALGRYNREVQIRAALREGNVAAKTPSERTSRLTRQNERMKLDLVRMATDLKEK